jgi:hypothetical protein
MLSRNNATGHFPAEPAEACGMEIQIALFVSARNSLNSQKYSEPLSFLKGSPKTKTPKGIPYSQKYPDGW